MVPVGRFVSTRAARAAALFALIGILVLRPPGRTVQAQSQRPAGVAPNGEVDGLTAKFVDINGISTRYFDYGKGEIAVLVHGGVGMGMSSTANDWSRNIPAWPSASASLHLTASGRA